MADQEITVLGADIEYIPREAPEQPDPPLVARMLMGMLLGTVSGVCFAGWEAALIGWLGLAVPNDSLGLRVVGIYAVTGALFGVLGGLTQHRGGGWALVTLSAAAAWLLSGKFGMALDEIGIPGLVAPFIGVPLAVVFAVTFTQTTDSESVNLGLAVAGFLVAVTLLPINLHFLGDPMSQIALTIDAVGVVLALSVGALVGGILGPRALFVPLLGLSTIVGWGLASQRLGVPVESWPTAKADKPPIVLVVIDTLRADHLGAYGYARPTSPRLDAFAAGALVYTDASSTASWTLPSTGSILTGRTVHGHGAGVHDGVRQRRTMLRGDVATVGERLRDAGYATAGIVTNPWMGTPYGFHRGFQAYDDAAGPWPLPVGIHPLQAMHLDPLGWPLYRDAGAITNQALDFVAQQDERGWFLLVHYMDPHGPHTPPAQDREAIGSAGDDAFTDDYDASIHYTDREFGRLLDGLPQDAWVIVVSDHGEQLTEERDVVGLVPPRTRHGHTLHRELLHVPLIIDGPGIGGRRVARPVSTIDLAPTLVALGGGKALAGIEGQALGEVTGSGTARTNQLAMGQRFGPEQQSIRQGDHKLVRREGHRELYDLRRDPGELNDLLEGGSASAVQRADQLEALLPPIGEGQGGPAPNLGAELLQVLEALGYADPEAPPPPGEEEALDEADPPDDP